MRRTWSRRKIDHSRRWWLPLLTCLAACEDPYTFDPHTDAPWEWIPFDVRAHLHESIHGEAPDEENDFEWFTAFDRELLAGIETLDLTKIPRASLERDGMQWLVFLTGLRELRLDLTDLLQSDDKYGETATTTIVKTPDSIRLSPSIRLPKLQQLWVRTNAPQRLDCFATCPELRRIQIVSRAPIAFEVFAQAPRLESVTIERPRGPNDISIVELGDAPSFEQRLSKLGQIRELDVATAWIEDFAPLQQLEKLRILRTGLESSDTRGLERLHQLEGLTLVAETFFDESSEEGQQTLTKLRTALPGCRIEVERR